MSARQRKCRTPDKVRYPTWETAITAARKLPFIVTPYKCRDHWHVTSNVRTKPTVNR